jgi:hypothetical protein
MVCMDFDVAIRLQGCFLVLIIQYERTVARTKESRTSLLVVDRSCTACVSELSDSPD